jgi:hypothetical protein
MVPRENGLDFAGTRAKIRTYCRLEEDYLSSQRQLGKQARKTVGSQGPSSKQDRAASSGREMTFIRDGVGGTYLTHHSRNRHGST